MPAAPATQSPPAAPPAAVHRVEISLRPGGLDAPAARVRAAAASHGLTLTDCHVSAVYLIAAPLSTAELAHVAGAVLADPVTEAAHIGIRAPCPGAVIVEVHPLPGVMDPAAESVALAIAALTGVRAEVVTGKRYDLSGATPAAAQDFVQRVLANPVIQRVTLGAYYPAAFPHGQDHAHGTIKRIPIIALDDAALERLAREAHLFLSLEEMRAIQSHYRALGGEPREIELETLAQTWSEHCVHKTLKSRITYRGAPQAGGGADPIDWSNRPRHTRNLDGSITIDNLLKATVAAATFELIEDGVDWTLSVFTDNSGVVALDNEFAVCIKVETHNHPSALEPYGGAATGIGGCIRDVIATGLGAQPIASTNVFCVAPPDTVDIPEGCLDPVRALTQVVAGVRDYGNRMGIPTVSGAVAFDPRYIGNPLVFCGCVGLLPRRFVKGRVNAGDRIIALGGRTGRDGIHGATFSSAELEHSAADEFAHAVQIGNAITQKRLLDAVMRARDDFAQPLYSGLTDCGAGGFSSAIGEMGATLGAEVHLERAPLKYPGLSATEIWISEAQERVVLAVPEDNLARLRDICAQESVELADLGHFGTPDAALILRFRGEEVGRMSMHLLHEGIPTPTREAVWTRAQGAATGAPLPTSSSSEPAPHGSTRESAAAVQPVLHQPKDILLALLAHPDIASKHWIIRQYDHEVRGDTVIKPLAGRAQRGPNDASVLEPRAGSNRGFALAQGLQTGLGDPMRAGAHADAYLMALAAIDECVRNLVCIGADPEQIAILDNFCWPSCRKPENLATLVRAAEGCYDGAKAYRTPFVSGKDSLNNQFTTRDGRTIEIPPTLLITGLGIVPALDRCITSDVKTTDGALLLIGPRDEALGGSHVQELLQAHSPSTDARESTGARGTSPGAVSGHNFAVPRTDLRLGPRTARYIAKLIREGLVLAAHDVSDGGALCTVAEMLIGAAAPGRPVGAALALEHVHHADPLAALFGAAPSRYVVEVAARHAHLVLSEAELAGIPAARLGTLNTTGVLTLAPAHPLAGMSVTVGDLAAAWLKPLDW
ncbi:phosphoribosylformylglycinamidine synthase subunit PurL [soil metagenome]